MMARRAAMTATTCIALLATCAATATAASFSRQGTGALVASKHSATDPGGGGLATAAYRINTGDKESARVIACQNADFAPDPNNPGGEPMCPGFSAHTPTVPANSSQTVEMPLKAGKWTILGASTVDGVTGTQTLEPVDVFDECGWDVKAAVGLAEGNGGMLARPGDSYPCGALSNFASGTPAPLAQILSLESTVDRSKLTIRGPGSFTSAPGRIGSAGDLNLVIRQENEGRIDLSTGRKFSRSWTILTPAAQSSLVDRKAPAKLRSTTTNGGGKTVVKNLGTPRVSVSTFGRGGAGSVPAGLLPFRQCVQLRKFTIVLRRGQSTTVRKNKPPSGGPAYARRSCRR